MHIKWKMYLLTLKGPQVPFGPRSRTEHGWVRRSVCPFVPLLIKTHFIVRLLLISLLRFLSSFPLSTCIWRAVHRNREEVLVLLRQPSSMFCFVFFSYNGFQSKCPQAAQAYDKIVFPTTVV